MSKSGITHSSLMRATQSQAQSAIRRRLLWRRIADKTATKCIGVGGISIILAVLLIFVFLFAEIIPMFAAAKVEPIISGELSAGDSRVLAVDADDRGEELMRVIEHQGEQVFRFDRFASLAQLEKNADASIDLGFKPAQQWIYDSLSGWFVTESQGVIEFGQLKEKEIFVGESRTLKPVLAKASPAQGFQLNNGLEKNESIELLQFKVLSKAIALSYAQSAPGDELHKIYLQVWQENRGFMAQAASYKPMQQYQLPVSIAPKSVYIDNQLRWAYAVSDHAIEVFRLKAGEAKLYTSVALEAKATASSMLLGSKSILIGDETGAISQWSLIRDTKNNSTLERLRVIQHGSKPIIQVQPEDRRRGFYALDAAGHIGIFFTTSERKLAQWRVEDFNLEQTKLISSPRSNSLIVIDEKKFAIFAVENHHPEVSFRSIWQKVRYEGYESAEHIWQSSAATNDFEPKLSLAPLAYGTLKATFYAMLFALPLAICGAIYTAYFMAPSVRKKVKPCIEFMEALPTVILGFLAGIWLAPLVETYLPGVLLVLIWLPIVMLITSFIWSVMPKQIKRLLSDGWEPVFLAPFMMVTVWVCFSLSIPLEQMFFGGDAKIWMRDTLGVSYDQRNSLVVGIAMGFAIIPTIFSIAEDAVFAVPKSLTFGSLALGASPWQTLVRVVLPTASPGIFSGVMIGTGRAVGETMIVLMATGSTPIMEMNIFEGFRTLSANIAIEMPEAEVHSTHYRLLFFAAFCLFIFTFLFNTTAEIVRQRLREKYGSL